MNYVSASSKRTVTAIAHIIARNVFFPINAIIFSVVLLLALFGDSKDGIFLGLITISSMVIGSFQEINAWRSLEKLQLLAAPRVRRIGDNGTETVIQVEEIMAGDKIKLAMGDQVPCDGTVASSHGLEVNEALITGESAVTLKKESEEILAGSIITSGSGVLLVAKVFTQSRIALMTQSVKKYTFELSPIQRSINILITYTSYVLIVVIFFVVGRGIYLHAPAIQVIQNIGALTSTLLPQGMVVIVALIFSYGAVHLNRRNILLQEINATEKIGRIKNLCMDKTGTLTGHELVVDQLCILPSADEKMVDQSILAYNKGTADSSQTAKAMQATMKGEYSGTILEDIAFSSSRQFGAVHIRDAFGERVVVAGAPDIFLPYIVSEEDRAWVQHCVDTEAKKGKRLLCFAQSTETTLPEELTHIKLSPLAIFVLTNGLREGITETIQFFQDRGVHIRIISGDNPGTVQAVAIAAGVHDAHSVITGTEIEEWDEADFLVQAPTYSIFARIKPEQKEKIIDALKHNGFTAMVGDGANDALAIKKADLGIAMFDGAQATRQIASILLVKNDFTDLPNGVRLADGVIQNIELCASIFFNQVFFGFFFFIILTVFGHAFPFTPLNVSFINYFTVGLPGFLIFYWILAPAPVRIVRDNTSFLNIVLPYAFISAIPQAIVAAVAFMSGQAFLAFIIIGAIFFMYTPRVYSGTVTLLQRKQLAVLIAIEVVLLTISVHIPIVVSLYNLPAPSLMAVMNIIPLLLVYVLAQYLLTKRYLMVH